MTEQKKTSTHEESQNSRLLFIQIFLKTTALSFLFVLLFLFLTAVVVGAVLGKKILQFEKLTSTPKEAIWSEVMQGFKKEPTQTNQHSNILILGTDAVSNRAGSQVLTDTIILVSADLNSGEVRLLSIPRDLWSNEYLTKVNALYAYGSDRYPEKPEKFTQEVISQMTGVDIHHTLVISLDTLAEMINILGGVEINVPTGFTDNEFPRSDVALNSTTPKSELYRSITFETGKQVMSGDRALEYIRSRHSPDGEGSDLARSQRQQLVIEALIAKLLNKKTLTDMNTFSSLYLLYKSEFNTQISLPELVSLGKALFPHRSEFSIKNESISLYPDNANGVIEHPNGVFYQNQWVYTIRSPENFQQEVQSKLLQN